MRLVLTALIFLGGIFFLVTGLGFLFDPATSAEGFGIHADNSTGLAAIRADMTAFFVVSAVCMMLGAWFRNGTVLLFPAAMFGIALLGRFISIFADGTTEGFWLPMVVEALTVIVLLIASRVLPHRDDMLADPA
ncbi:DUF4345 family protein [Erythrobacter sp. HKB08]|uniref:DUF4345 family protein n=1 Tax=Erythrobacter sp. HKB08 TaxID=2502843 RepID=UPI001009261F|nr:DUF4345 family protein [Erythrobacter sp. HKB08]